MKNNNIKLIAYMNETNGIDIYIDQSGFKNYLMHHKYSDELYSLIKDGRRIDDLRRLSSRNVFTNTYRSSTQKRRNRVAHNVIDHVLDVADCYVSEMIA